MLLIQEENETVANNDIGSQIISVNTHGNILDNCNPKFVTNTDQVESKDRNTVQIGDKKKGKKS